MTEMSTKKYLSSLLVCSLVVVAAPALAASTEPVTDPPPQIRKVEPVGHWAYSRLTAAHDAMGAERLDEALAELEELRANENLNSHERAMMWQTFGYLHGTAGRQDEAIRSFRACLEADGLPATAHLSVLTNLAQLQLMEGEYDAAIASFNRWFEQAPKLGAEPTPERAANLRYMLALAYAQAGRHSEALPHILASLENTPNPNEGRLQLLSAIYFRLESYPELVPVLRKLTTHFPKKAYWMQLSAIYAELDRLGEALAVQETVFEQGMFDQQREYLTLARLLLHHGVPFEAAQVIEKGIGKGQVGDDPEVWDTLASSYLQAREYDRAVRPLEQSAKRAKDGEAYLRLGEVYLTRQKWSEAGDALVRGIGKGGLRNTARAHLLLGIARVNTKHLDDAESAFAAAARSKDLEGAARQWLQHVERERMQVAEENRRAAAETAPKNTSGAQADAGDASLSDSLDG